MLPYIYADKLPLMTIESNQLERIKNYVHNAKADLAKQGKHITEIKMTYNVITGDITDISFLNGSERLLRHFGTDETQYDDIMAWLLEDQNLSICRNT